MSGLSAAGEPESYIFGSAATGNPGTPLAITQWIADPEGVRESWVPSGSGGTNFRSYDVWKDSYWDGKKLPGKVLAVVDKEVTDAGGSGSSLVVVQRYDAQGWADALERNADGEPGLWVTTAVNRLDPRTVIRKTETADGSVFSYTENGVESQIVVSAEGLIEEFSGTVGWLAPGTEMTMDARGEQVVVPEGIAAAVNTRAPEQAVDYVRERRQLRLAVQELSGKAKSIAERQDSRVTKNVLARAVARMRGFQYVSFHRFRAVEKPTGFLVVAKSNADYELFGDVCATVSPGRSKPHVSYC